MEFPMRACARCLAETGSNGNRAAAPPWRGTGHGAGGRSLQQKLAAQALTASRKGQETWTTGTQVYVGIILQRGAPWRVTMPRAGGRLT